MSEWIDPWRAPGVAAQQLAVGAANVLDSDAHRALARCLRPLVDRYERALDVVEVGCGAGYVYEAMLAHEMRVQWTGIDPSAEAIERALDASADGRWINATLAEVVEGERGGIADVIVDGACLMHVEDWREHLRHIELSARQTGARYVVLHRVPIGPSGTIRRDTRGYGQTFPAWSIGMNDLLSATVDLGWVLTATTTADGGSGTLVFARTIHVATYYDQGYDARARAMIRSIHAHHPAVAVHVLSLDGSADYKQPGVDEMRVAPNGWERFHKARSKIENMWSLGAWWLTKLTQRNGYREVWYVDADVWFHGPALDEARGDFVEHGFPESPRRGVRRETHIQFGYYNLGVARFTHESATEFLELCNEHCAERPAFGRPFADQGHLQTLVERGLGRPMDSRYNLGPWGVHRDRWYRAPDGKIRRVRDNQRLLAYHYSGFSAGRVASPEYEVTPAQDALFYSDYRRALTEAE